ncbi:MAG: dihydroorotate dehydrogenase electron transfer subunit [Candidatus Omnitrophota bacterium]|jgi:dihydroorotate dehydrogenase electron transfer subunit|nr:MAG: dihydroorotate dehydrogenase electron transfer subunit [Candidatus Omnitrophota bacterium]
MHLEKATLLYNKPLGKNYFRLACNAAKIANDAVPGQFVSVKINNTHEPFLRRPFGIHKVDGCRIEILYEAVGEGTRLLSKNKQGSFLDILGPLGNGYDYRYALIRHKTPVLVAGGMGVAPLFFLAEKLVRSLGRKVRHSPRVLLGAKSKNQILCEKEFKKIGCSVTIATDNGSAGFKGKVTDLLKQTLSTLDCPLSTALYACGPRPMLAEVSRISRKHGIFTQVSLEEHMACGIGACLGCVVKTKDGYKRVCKEGPVFNSEEIVWEKHTKGGR